MPQQAPDADPKCILVVDDDEVIRNFVSRLLTRDGYDVVVAGTGDEALRLSKDHKGTIHLLISNIQMPGITGMELGARLSQERAELKVMLMSGFSAGLLVLNEGWHFLHKPFVPSQLLSIVKEALAQPSVPNLNERQ
jgi:two-component system cell cycle sensor histidine kinase/response regulator CckA